jgi:hypothetical protein
MDKSNKFINKSKNTIRAYYGIGYDFIKFKTREYIIHFFDVGKVECLGKVMTITYYKNEVKYKITTPTLLSKHKDIVNISVAGQKGTDTCVDGTGADFDENIDTDLNYFCGPYMNFHGIPTTPRMMGVNVPVLVTYKDGQTYEYNADDIILTKTPIKKIENDNIITKGDDTTKGGRGDDVPKTTSKNIHNYTSEYSFKVKEEYVDICEELFASIPSVQVKSDKVEDLIYYKVKCYCSYNSIILPFLSKYNIFYNREDSPKSEKKWRYIYPVNLSVTTNS